MANSGIPIKGVLKQLESDPTLQKSVRDPREIAIQHARVLEHRKQLEAQILESIITLSEYPLNRSPEFSAANPAPSDVAGFKDNIRLYQPSDYDDLVLERNAVGLCGYALCPNPKRKATPGGAWKLVGGNGKGFDIVNRKEHEKWCSSFCARQALYVRVQLNESAAWERVGIPDIDIDILQDSEKPKDKPDEDKAVAEEQQKRNQIKAAGDAAALAVERGDTDRTGPLITVTLRPKEITTPPTAIDPDDPEFEDGHVLLEGYKPKTTLDI